MSDYRSERAFSAKDGTTVPESAFYKDEHVRVVTGHEEALLEAVPTVMAKSAANRDFRTRVAKLLKQIEWCAWDGVGAEDHCPVCDWHEKHHHGKHAADCELAALLKEAES